MQNLGALSIRSGEVLKGFGGVDDRNSRGTRANDELGGLGLLLAAAVSAKLQ